MKMSLLLTSPRPLRLAVILTNVPIVNVIQWGAFHTDYGAVRLRRERDIFYVIALAQIQGQGRCAICPPRQRHSRGGAVEAEVASWRGESRPLRGHDDVAGGHQLAPGGGGQLARGDPRDDWNRQPCEKSTC